MKKGWKTRIDEREYFENKQQEREKKRMILALMQSQMDQETREALARLHLQEVH